MNKNIFLVALALTIIIYLVNVFIFGSFLFAMILSLWTAIIGGASGVHLRRWVDG